MNYYRITEKLPTDFRGLKEPLTIDQVSHDFVETKTGLPLMDYSEIESGDPFVGPLICKLDDEDETDEWPAFFMSPAFITTKDFYQSLLDFGVSNIEVHDVLIKDKKNDRDIRDYLLLNIIGRVIDESKIGEQDLFLLDEDTDCILFSEPLYEFLRARGFTDIVFDTIELS